jgi:hypothetical protein
MHLPNHISSLLLEIIKICKSLGFNFVLGNYSNMISSYDSCHYNTCWCWSWFTLKTQSIMAAEFPNYCWSCDRNSVWPKHLTLTYYTLCQELIKSVGMLHLVANAVHIAVVRSLNMWKTNAVVVQTTRQLSCCLAFSSLGVGLLYFMLADCCWPALRFKTSITLSHGNLSILFSLS